MKRLNAAFLLAATVALSASALAQDANAPSGSPEYFRLDFALKETEGGKLVNSRAYQMMVRTNETNMSSIRSGGRVPVSSGEKSVTYIDVGVNIDVRRVNHSVKDELNFEVTSEVSGTIDPPSPQTPFVGPPVIRQSRWNSIVAVPLRKPTVVFSSDDPTSKRQLQLEITATPIH